MSETAEIIMLIVMLGIVISGQAWIPIVLEWYMDRQYRKRNRVTTHRGRQTAPMEDER